MRTFSLSAIAFLEKFSWLPLLISRLFFAFAIAIVFRMIGEELIYLPIIAQIFLLIIGIGIAFGLFMRIMFGAAIALFTCIIGFSNTPLSIFLIPTALIPTLICLSMILLGLGKVSIDTIIAKKTLDRPLKKSVAHICSSTIYYLNALRWLPLFLLRLSVFIILFTATKPPYSIADIAFLSLGGIYLIGLFTRVVACLSLIPLILISEHFEYFILFGYIISVILFLLIALGPGKLSLDALIKSHIEQILLIFSSEQIMLPAHRFFELLPENTK